VARLDPLPMEALTPEQKLLHTELGRTRKRVSGPFAIWLRNPPLADAANRVTLALRENGKLARRFYELIVLIVVRHWSAPYAWAAHEGAAVAAGLPSEVIEAIRNRRKPEFQEADERTVYETVTELLETKALSSASYDRLIRQFGVDLTIEIVTIAGFYGMVATVLKGFDVPTPNGERPFG
jgi:4-carboxymuconolactone decarboxylase